VRHHHEQWSGRGYPAGISGTDIPLGARILSVVDCFDALTSDRPYRPRLTTEEAFATITNGRGTLYDPLVVDTFVKAYPEIAPAALKAGDESTGLVPTSAFSDLGATSPLRQIRLNATETSLLDVYRRQVASARSSKEAVDAAAQCLRQLTGATVFAFYRYDRIRDLLICEYAVGDGRGLLHGLEIAVGSRVTGWSAATGKISLNANASLDLSNISEMFDPCLRSVSSTPIHDGEDVVGVLTAYASKPVAFSESHTYAFEQIAASLADTLGTVSSSDRVRTLAFHARNR
jgi:putative methionine-R-sulfoxide reductase with GAF domain